MAGIAGGIGGAMRGLGAAFADFGITVTVYLAPKLLAAQNSFPTRPISCSNHPATSVFARLADPRHQNSNLQQTHL